MGVAGEGRVSRSSLRGVCVIPRCSRVGEDQRAILCAEHLVLVPEHLRREMKSARRAINHRATRSMYAVWHRLAVEAVRYVLVQLWGTVFAQPPGHTWWGGECWCPTCTSTRELERPGWPPEMAASCRPCVCPLCTQAAAMAPRALERRYCVDASRLSTDGVRQVRPQRHTAP
jgi:hypothetical protein